MEQFPEGLLSYATREGPLCSLAVHSAEWNFPRLLAHVGALACPCWLPGCSHLWVCLLAPGLCSNLGTLLGQTEHGQLSFLTLSPKFFKHLFHVFAEARARRLPRLRHPRGATPLLYCVWRGSELPSRAAPRGCPYGGVPFRSLGGLRQMASLRVPGQETPFGSLMLCSPNSIGELHRVGALSNGVSTRPRPGDTI